MTSSFCILMSLILDKVIQRTLFGLDQRHISRIHRCDSFLPIELFENVYKTHFVNNSNDLLFFHQLTHDRMVCDEEYTTLPGYLILQRSTHMGGHKLYLRGSEVNTNQLRTDDL